MRPPTQTRGHRRPSHSARRAGPVSAFLNISRIMPSTFNIIRASVYSLVVIWSIICLAIAVHFQGILSSSDLTRFVPFAIFVSSASLVIMLALLAFGLRKNMNPISTRIELGCLGLAGTFWLALGAFLASSDSETASVECFASEADTSDPIDVPGFSTETYQAQYRVLEAFSLFNVVLVWGFLLFLFGLALRQYLMGKKQVWLSPVTTYDWFGRGSKQASKLPPPVTARHGRSRSRTAAVAPPKRQPSEKRTPGTYRAYPSQENQTYYVSMPQKAAAKAHTKDRTKRDYYHRDASPRR